VCSSLRFPYSTASHVRGLSAESADIDVGTSVFGDADAVAVEPFFARFTIQD
jgi:hypothetical protein